MTSAKLLIDNKEISLDVVTCSTMNFGQKVHGLVPSKYKLVMVVDEFTKVINPDYEKFVRENLEDEPYHKFGEFPEIDKLISLKYPSINELANLYPDLLEIIVKEWLYSDLFARLFPYCSLEEIKHKEYIINSVEEVKINGNEIMLVGEIYPSYVK